MERVLSEARRAERGAGNDDSRKAAETAFVARVLALLKNWDSNRRIVESSMNEYVVVNAVSIRTRKHFTSGSRLPWTNSLRNTVSIWV